MGWGAAFTTTNVKSAHSTGLKSANKGDRPPLRCLAHLWWGGDPDLGDYSLYDSDGLTVARIVLADGRYNLRSPLAWPCQSWSDLDDARRHAETIALAALPIDSKLAAAARRNNETRTRWLGRKLAAAGGEQIPAQGGQQ
jgi:hypothetical protein